MNYQSPFSRKI